jgi:opacity protein-like surface antigen
MRRPALTLAFAASLTALASLVAPAALASPKPEAAPERPVAFSAGAKLFVGGSLYGTPSNPTVTGLGFAGSAGGFGYGGGAYVEARFIKYLGLEVGLGYDQADIHRKITFNGTTDVTEHFVTKSLRIPILFKAIIPAEFGRLSFGIGPELVSAMSPSASLDLPQLPAGSTAPPAISAEKAGGTRLLLDFGIAIDLPGGLELPIGMRASKALSQPDAWADRVHTDLSTYYSVKAESSWDFRLDLGLGYRF